MPKTQKRILVTGGAGFVGSHLVDRLLGQGHKIVCLDDLSTGHTHNIQHLGNPDFSFLQQCVTTPINIDTLDEIYNLACPASPVQYQRDPIGTLMTSVAGARNVLELARRTDCRILQASTSEVYGDPDVHPQPEDYRGNVNTIGPRACYDEGKRCAETLFFDYHRQHGLDVRIVRIFNTYGPRMRPGDGRVVSNFIVQALSGESITLYGNGKQTRSFCYVDDLVNGLLAAMASPQAAARPINLGNPVEISVAELAERVMTLTGSSSRIVHEPLPQDDPRRRCPDISLAKNILGWAPSVDLDTGIGKTVRYFEKLLDSATIPAPRVGTAG